tara:strand:+ start:1194 stop:2000 length:807 start_codon:yes stop_codon:yes gene_type:complete
MTLEYHIGNSATPKGHALVYFRDGSNPDRVGASYVVTLPVSVDISKYVPPFLAGQVEQLGSGDMSSFSFPPAPEPVPSEAWLRETAIARSDDLLFGGVVDLDDITSLMAVVADISEEYAEQCEKLGIGASDHESEFSMTNKADDRESSGSVDTKVADVNDVMYSMMSEPDLLTELTTLMGRFQYECSGGDTVGALESEAKIRSIAKHVPENRRIDLMIEAAADGRSDSAKRAQLYLDRAFAMYREDYTRVHVIEEEIKTIGDGRSSAS